MKSTIMRTLLVVAAAFLLAGAWQLASDDAWDGWSRHLALRAIPAGGLAAFATIACRRLRNEDRGARLDAERCCRRGARGRDDDALAEADLLLARLTVHTVAGAEDEPAPDSRLEAQLVQVHAELAQLQEQAGHDLARTARIERLHDRPMQAAPVMHGAGGAA